MGTLISKITNGLLDIIRKSMFGPDGKYSHTRISSYFILGSILFFNLVCAGIDIVNGIFIWKHGGAYHIPPEHIFIYSLTLTHHLVLLGLKKGSETNYMNAKVKMEEISQGKVLPNDDVRGNTVLTGSSDVTQSSNNDSTTSTNTDTNTNEAI